MQEALRNILFYGSLFMTSSLAYSKQKAYLCKI